MSDNQTCHTTSGFRSCLLAFYQEISQRFLTALLISFCSPLVSAQAPDNYVDYLNLTSENGLPSDEVYHVVQDKEGFLWFATDNGVVRYDGSKLDYFTMADGLTDNVVYKLYIDDQDRVWCKTSNTKLCYFTPDLEIVSYKYNDVIQKYIDEHSRRNSVAIMLSLNVYKDEVSIGFTGYEPIFISKDGKITHFPDPNRSVLFVHHGQHLMTSRLGIPKKWKNPKITLFGQQLEFQSQDTLSLKANISTTCRLSKERIGASYGQLLLIHSSNQPVQIHSVPAEIISLDNFDDSLIWVGTYQHGVFAYTLREDRLVLKYHFYGNISISSVHKDRNGTYWFTSLEKGIFYLPSLSFRSHSLRSEHVNYLDALMVNHQLLLVDSKGGTYQFDRLLHQKLPETTTTTTEKMMLHHESEPGRVLFPGGIKPFIKGGYQFYPYIGAPPGKGGHHIEIGGWIIGVFANNIRSFQPGGMQYNYEHFASIKGVATNGNRLMTIHSRGASLFRVQNGRVTRIKNFLQDQAIRSIKNYKDAFFLLSRSGNIYKVSKMDRLKLEYATNEHFVVNDFVITDQHFWIASNSGLFRVDRNTKEVKILWAKAVKKIFQSGNRFVACLPKGVISFENYDVADRSTLKIESILVNGTPTKLRKFISGKDQLSLKIRCIGAIPGSSPSIKCVILGRNGTLTYSINDILQLPDLEPDVYSAYMENTQTGARSEVIHFEVVAPFWQRTSTLLICGILLVSIAFLVIRTFYKRKEKKILLEKQIGELRSSALRSQMNPHFIFNCMNVVQSLISSRNHDKASDVLIKLSRLVRKTLNYSKRERVSLQEELDFTQTYFDLENIRMHQTMSLEIVHSTDLNLEKVSILPISIQPLVENAVIHGIVPSEASGLINIEVWTEEELIFIKVCDNGVGIKEKSGGRRSYGIQILEERLQLANRQNSISLESGENGVCVTIKISYEHYTFDH